MVPNPLALIAEVTHRCPLHCVYCSNPVQLAGTQSELSTDEWRSIFQQAGKLGMLHAHLRLWEESVAAALRRKWRSLGRGEIAEFQPRIVAR